MATIHVGSMLFFFILPVWVVTALAALAMIAIRRSRTVGVHLLLASTGALIASFALSTATLLLAARWLGGTDLGWVALLAYLITIGIGGLAGGLAGVLLARKLTIRR